MIKNYKPFFTFVAIFFLSLYPVVDTDFGWHLRVGEYIFKTLSVPQKDLFSFSLPNFPYVYYSWAGELLLFIFYRAFGFLGPSIFFALILTGSMYVIYKTSRNFNKEVYLPLFLIATPIAHVLAGGRMRVFGLLFFSIFYYLLTKFLQKKPTFLISIPLVFLFWSNFHASFILGVGVFLIILILNFSYPLLLTLLASIGAIFINPYFGRIWQQAFTITTNELANLNAVNPDWQSPLNHGLWGYLYLLIFSVILFWIARSKFSFTTKSLNFVLFFLSLITQRFMFALFVVFLPAANYLILNAIKKLKEPLKLPIVKFSLYSLYLVFGLLMIVNISKTFFAHSNFENYTYYLSSSSPNKNLYYDWSDEAANYLSNNLSTKNILSEANWGGLLLLRNADFKLFYYGAMDNFKTEDGQLFPFIYLDLINSRGDWQAILDKYKVEVVYLPNNYPLVALLKNNAGWRLVFGDENASVLVKD